MSAPLRVRIRDCEAAFSAPVLALLSSAPHAPKPLSVELSPASSITMLDSEAEGDRGSMLDCSLVDAIVTGYYPVTCDPAPLYFRHPCQGHPSIRGATSTRALASHSRAPELCPIAVQLGPRCQCQTKGENERERSHEQAHRLEGRRGCNIQFDDRRLTSEAPARAHRSGHQRHPESSRLTQCTLTVLASPTALGREDPLLSKQQLAPHMMQLAALVHNTEGSNRHGADHRRHEQRVHSVEQEST